MKIETGTKLKRHSKEMTLVLLLTLSCHLKLFGKSLNNFLSSFSPGQDPARRRERRHGDGDQRWSDHPESHRRRQPCCQSPGWWVTSLSVCWTNCTWSLEPEEWFWFCSAARRETVVLKKDWLICVCRHVEGSGWWSWRWNDLRHSPRCRAAEGKILFVFSY